MAKSQHTSFAEEISGHWMEADQLDRLPNVGRDFDEARDPLVKAQLADTDKSEAQRRGDGNPQTSLKMNMPPDWLRGVKDSPTGENGFLSQQFTHAIARASPNQGDGPAITPSQGPSQGSGPTPGTDGGQGPSR